jgi:arylformamidase
MQVQFNHRGEAWLADLSGGVDIAIPVSTSHNVRAWGLKHPEISPHRNGEWVGSIREGASVNFNDIRFNPHGHGTHTECLGHITRESQSVLSQPPPPWMIATLVSLTPEKEGSDRIISRSQIETALPRLDTDCLILRTLPNKESKKSRDYSGTNPPYLQAGVSDWLREQGVYHLLLDLPSVDREEDGGSLEAHKAFWGIPGAPRPSATITELIYVPGHIEDGMYLLNLQMAAFENDACPSRPLLFPVRRMSEKEGLK